jgi:hypothetical protein
VLDSHGGFVDNQDGSRSIMPSARDLTLVIRQTAEGHEQVAERLDQLDRLLKVRESGSEDKASSNPQGALPTLAQTRTDMSDMMRRAMGGQGQPGNSGRMSGMMGGQPGNSSYMAQMAGHMSQMSGAANSQGQPSNSGPISGAMNSQGQSGSQSSSNAPSSGGALPATTPPPGNASNGEPGALAGQQGGNQPGVAVYTLRQLMATPADVAPNQSGRPQGATQYDVNIVPSPAAVTGHTLRVDSAHEPETERRLRSLEEKLDRVLKALDVPRGNAPKDDRPQDALPR